MSVESAPNSPIGALTSSGRHPSSPIRTGALAWSLVAAIFVLHAWMLFRYTVNFPFQDDFTQLLAVPSFFDWHPDLRSRIAYLFELSVEHRIATLRLVALVQAKVFGGVQLQWMMVYGIVLVACAATLVVLQAVDWQRPWLALVAAMLLASPAIYISQYWATGAVQHLGMIFYAFASLYCATRLRGGWTILGMVLAGAAACTAANGLFVFVVAALVLAYAREFRWAALWTIAASAMFAIYFLGYEPPTGRAPPLEALRDPVRLFLGWAAALGSIAGARTPAIVVGLLLVFGFGAVAWGVRRGSCNLALLAWLLFPILSAAAIAAGRLPWGDEEVLNSRYRVYSAMAVLTASTSLLRLLPRRFAVYALGVLASLTLAWAVHNWHNHVLAVADLFARQRLSLDRFAATGHSINAYFPPQEYGDYLLSRAIDRNEFVVSSASPPLFPSAATPPTGSESAHMHAETPVAEFDTLSVRGRAPAFAGTVVLWLAGESSHLRAELRTRRIFSHWKSRDLSVFWGTLSTRDMVPGRYRVGLEGTLGGGGVTWTDHWVTIP